MLPEGSMERRKGAVLSAYLIVGLPDAKEPKRIDLLNVTPFGFQQTITERITPADIDQWRKELNISGNHVGLFVGGMYPEKKLPLLIKSLLIIRQAVPDFEMIFIGSGVEAEFIAGNAAKYPWIHYLGPKFDREKVKFFALSHLFLMPGLVGLAILDSFALGVPLVTTNIAEHSSEIDYLKDGLNGVMVTAEDDPDAYAQAVIDLFLDEAKRQKLVQGCVESSHQYTLEEMVERYAQGIKLALGR